MGNLPADPAARVNKINHLGGRDGHLLVVVTPLDVLSAGVELTRMQLSTRIIPKRRVWKEEVCAP
jgi:hypothetical protein